jgi:hypothetical protein
MFKKAITSVLESVYYRRPASPSFGVQPALMLRNMEKTTIILMVLCPINQKLFGVIDNSYLHQIDDFTIHRFDSFFICDPRSRAAKVFQSEVWDRPRIITETNTLKEFVIATLALFGIHFPLAEGSERKQQLAG